MGAIRVLLSRLISDRRGATAVEYALIASLIVLAMVGGLAALGGGTSGMWTQLGTTIADAV